MEPQTPGDREWVSWLPVYADKVGDRLPFGDGTHLHHIRIPYVHRKDVFDIYKNAFTKKYLSSLPAPM